MDKIVITLISILSGILLMSCDINNSDEKTPPIKTFKALVEGELRKENGAAVGNVNIKVITHEAGCDDEKVSQGMVQATSDGRFSKQIIDVAAKTIHCVTLEVSANSTLNVPDTTISYDTDLNLNDDEPFEEKVLNVTY